nr:MAG TPA: hypothetical protein [Caudoviricetes sp.]
MDKYTPTHLLDIQQNIHTITDAADRAADKLERSTAYRDQLHPWHSSAVATYNRLVSILLDLQGLEV